MPKYLYMKMELLIQVASTCALSTVILFLCAGNHTVSGIHWQLIKVFGELVTIGREMVCQWVHQFHNIKRCDVHDLAYEGCPCLSLLTSDSIAGVCALLTDDKRLTMR